MGLTSVRFLHKKIPTLVTAAFCLAEKKRKAPTRSQPKHSEEHDFRDEADLDRELVSNVPCGEDQRWLAELSNWGPCSPPEKLRQAVHGITMKENKGK